VAVLSDPSVTVNKRTGRAPADVRSLMAIYGAHAVSIDRKARDFKIPDQFEWKPRPGSAGQTAALFGDPSKPGLYVQSSNAAPTIGASLTPIRTRDSSRFWREPF
jgi:hypothetical protein